MPPKGTRGLCAIPKNTVRLPTHDRHPGSDHVILVSELHTHTLLCVMNSNVTRITYDRAPPFRYPSVVCNQSCSHTQFWHLAPVTRNRINKKISEARGRPGMGRFCVAGSGRMPPKVLMEQVYVPFPRTLFSFLHMIGILVVTVSFQF